MTDAYAARELLASGHYDLRPSNARPCPRVAAERRHLDEGCICQTYGNALDHPAIWLDPRGRHVFTFEPYQLDGADLLPMLLDFQLLGLQVMLTGCSLWNRETFLVMLRKAP